MEAPATGTRRVTEARARLSPASGAVLLVWVALAGIGASAFACAGLATLNLSTASGPPGTTVTLTGAAFAHPRASTGLPPTTVVVRWRDENGPILAEVTPDRYGSIAASFTVPQAAPGTYAILAVQETPRRSPDAAPDAAPVYLPEPGTPARASFEVLRLGASPVIRAPGAERVDGSQASSQFDSTVWIVLTAAFGAVALSLFGGGVIAFVHQSRKAKEPAAARWIPPGW